MSLLMQPPREYLNDAAVFRKEVLQWIEEENLWNIWVPKAFGGLECSLSDGLKTLQALARLDGSLGWTVTLCSGANFFIGNLQPEVAREVFAHSAILGGSGGMFGTAEKEGDAYRLNGTWRYATGAPYLTHFTLNAKIIENGIELKNENGTPKFLSFVIPAAEVTVIEDWQTMGLKASATHSFKVNNVVVHERFSFIYNQFYHPQSVFKIHFSVFADLTLWVNYIGMADHFMEESAKVVSTDRIDSLASVIRSANQELAEIVQTVDELIDSQKSFTGSLIKEVHGVASASVKKLSEAIISLYPMVGIKGSKEDHILNQIFRDYFTATQHHIFTKGEKVL